MLAIAQKKEKEKARKIMAIAKDMAREVGRTARGGSIAATTDMGPMDETTMTPTHT